MSIELVILPVDQEENLSFDIIPKRIEKQEKITQRSFKLQNLPLKRQISILFSYSEAYNDGLQVKEKLMNYRSKIIIDKESTYSNPSILVMSRKFILNGGSINHYQNILQKQEKDKKQSKIQSRNISNGYENLKNKKKDKKLKDCQDQFLSGCTAIYSSKCEQKLQQNIQNQTLNSQNSQQLQSNQEITSD